MNTNFTLRNMGLSLIFIVCRIDCNYRAFTCCPERRVMAGLVFTIILTMSQYNGLAGLLRDIDTGHMGYMEDFHDLVESGVACVVSNCADHFWRSL